MSQLATPQNSALFHLVVENVRDFAVFMTDLEGRVVSWNPGVGRLLGYSEEEWVGSHSSVIFTPEDRERGEPEREMEVALGQGCAEDKRWHMRKDGSLFWADGMLMLLRDEAGGLHGFAKILRDNTEAKLTEDRLREHVALTDAIAGNILEGIHVLDREGRITFTNRAARELLGYGADELMGRGQHETVHSLREDGTAHPIEECPVVAVLRTGEPLRDYETVYRRKDGSLFQVLCTAAPLTSGGRISGAVMSFHDITARRRGEAELRESEERFRTLAETASDVIVTIDEQSRVLFINAAAEKVFGYRPEELTGESLSLLMPEYLRHLHRAGLGRYVETGRRHISWDGIELPGLHKDGREIPLEVSFGEFRQGGRQVFTGIIRDIRERKRAEAEREALLQREQALRAEAESANRLKDEFLATLSHELRTPLTAVLGWARLLRSGALDEASAARAVEAVERNAEAQRQLIEDVLDVSRIVAGKLRLDMRPVKIISAVEAAVDSVRPAAESKGVRLAVVSEAPAAGVVSGDAHRLQQVFWNLLTNAVKFTHAGGQVEVRVAPAGGEVRVDVSDTGQGIAPEFLPHVFDRFRQADQQITRKHGGLGLGLSIVRNLVEAHGGTIRAESEGAERGATFTVTLPLAREGSGGEQSPWEGGAAASPFAGAGCPPPLHGLKVLVVDDEADTRDFLRALLEHCEVEVREAPSGDEALKVLDNYEPDVLVSDIGMPGMSGYELLRQVRRRGRQRGRHVPALALTGYAQESDRLTAIRAGFQTHLSKPVEPDDLLAAVASLAGRYTEDEE